MYMYQYTIYKEFFVGKKFVWVTFIHINVTMNNRGKNTIIGLTTTL